MPRPSVVLTFVRRDFLTTRSYRFALVMDWVLGSLSLVIYYFISTSLIGSSRSAGLNGAPSYFAFAAVGVALSVVIQAAASAVSTKLREEQLIGTLEVLVTQPVRTSELALGIAGYPFFFSILRAAFYLGLAALVFGADYSDADWLGAAVVLLLTGAVLMSIGIVIAALVLAFKRTFGISALLIFPLVVLGGAFFPVSALPSWLEAVGRLVPTRFSFDGVRSALYTGGGWVTDALILAGVGAVALPFAVFCFSQALEYSIRAGNVSQY